MQTELTPKNFRLIYTKEGQYKYPSDPVSLDPFRCTKDNIWNKSKCLWAEHMEVERISPEGDYNIIRAKEVRSYRCINCGYEWTEYWN